MLVFLPHGSATGRVNELRGSARKRFELEALAIEKYERDVVGYRVYMPVTPRDVAAARKDAASPNRSVA